MVDTTTTSDANLSYTTTTASSTSGIVLDEEKDEKEKKQEKPKETNGDKKYTDEDVDKIVAKKVAKLKAQQEQAVKEAKEEAAKLAKMNADQKRDYELEKLKAENEKLKEEQIKIELAKTATQLLKEEKIEATQEMLDFVVGTDAESTQANIKKFVDIINTQIELAERRRATGKTPKSYSTGDGKTVSREDIMSIKNPVERQKAIAKNIGLFKD